VKGLSEVADAPCVRRRVPHVLGGNEAVLLHCRFSIMGTAQLCGAHCGKGCIEAVIAGCIWRELVALLAMQRELEKVGSDGGPRDGGVEGGAPALKGGIGATTIVSVPGSANAPEMHVFLTTRGDESRRLPGGETRGGERERPQRRSHEMNGWPRHWTWSCPANPLARGAASEWSQCRWRTPDRE
jgi:hypothetical protein